MSDQNDIRIDIVGSVEGLKPATAEAGRELDKVNDAAGKTGGALSDLGRDAAKEAAEGLGMSSRAATVASNAIGALRTPVAVAVTALAALAAGWIKGAKEEQEFSRSLILSNNAIGSSVDQLRALAMESSSATRSQSALSDALAKLAATGEVSTNGLSSAARVATDLARLGVQSVSETVGQFERLGREPVAAILRLNDQYRFLTASVFQQIQALDTEGRREEAAALAQRTYSAAMEERTQKLGASLGSLERMWKGVGDAARQAWDMMLAVGRTRSLQSRIDELRQKAAPGRGIFSGLSDSEKSELSRLESQLAYEQRIAQAAGDRAKKEEAALAWLREGEEYLDKQARLARELAKIDALGEQAGVSKAEIAARKEAARAKYADKTSISEAAALLKEQYANRLATIKESLAAEDGLLRIARARGELDERAYLDRLGEAQRESFAARAAVLREQLATATKPADRERILGDIQKLGAEAAAAANASTLAYVELDKAARATLATLTSEAWGEVGQLATDNAALREELVTLGMTTQQLDEYRRQKTLAAQESANDFADALEEAAAAIDSEGEAAQRAKQYYLDLATARRAAAEQFGERATLERQLATSREALRLATESAKVWQEGWQETDRIARDAFVAWADDGASAAERIGQSLRAALLSAIYEATLRPIALQVYTTAAGALGLSGGAAGAGAGSNLLGMASNAKSLYDLASGDYGLYGSFATSQYGQALGLSTAGVTASSIGTGASLGYGGLFANGATAGSTSGVASMSTLGSALPWAAGGGILAGVLYGGKGQSAAGGAIGAGVGYATAAGSAWASGAAMGSWAGPIGALAGAVIGGFLGSRIGGGERFKSTYGSASGAFDDGRYTSTGAWQGGRQFGDDVDQVLDRATQAFSAR
ncbi:MAG: phage tail length tape measure family protein, partial [Rhodocyclaceae bacterium]|nr:phage tail length tape measure family protein [Rhodocyclaceae bacterium]